MKKSKLNEKLINRLVFYYLLVDDQVVVRTISKDTIIEQYEFQRLFQRVSKDRISIIKDDRVLSEFKFN